MSIPKKLILSLVIGFIILTYFYYSLNNERNNQETATIVSPVSLWNQKITEKFNDEPKFEKSEIASESSWIIPSDPDTIKVNQSFLFPIDKYFEDKVVVAEEWERWPTFKEDLDEQNLEDKYYNYFLKTSKLPRAKQEVDVNSDGIKDMLFTSIGVGCASCHLQYIDIFINDKVYLSTSNEGKLYPRSDGKGFYITNAFTGNNYATCCPDKFIISRYEWNGKGFTEIARKNVFLKE